MNMPTPEEIAIIPFCLYIHFFFCSTYIFSGTWGTDDELLAARPVDLSIVADSSQILAGVRGFALRSHGMLCAGYGREAAN